MEETNHIDFDEMSLNHKTFVRQYILTRSKVKSYQEAYPETTYQAAAAAATRLMKREDVRAYLSYMEKNIEELVGISKAKVLREQARIAFANMENYRDSWVSLKEYEGLSSGERAAVSEIETKTWTDEDGNINEIVKLKLYDKSKALESIAKMMGYNESTKIDHTTGGEQMQVLNEFTVIHRKESIDTDD